MDSPAIAIIGGSGIEKEMFEMSHDIEIKASYKSHSKQITKSFHAKEVNIDGRQALFVNRYKVGMLAGKEKYHPHEIDYKTLFVGLYQAGIKKIISISKVGSMEKEWVPGTIILLNDCIDLVNRDITLDDIGIDVADMSVPFSPQLSELIKKNADKVGVKIAVGCTHVVMVDGSRLETPAEIQMIRNMVKDRAVVGMIASTEAQLAKSLGIEFAALVIATNYAAGMRTEINKSIIEGGFEKALPQVTKILRSTIKNLSA